VTRPVEGEQDGEAKTKNEIGRIAKKWSQNLLTKRSKREILPLRKGSERKYKKCSNPAGHQASQEGRV
jgi:hypothetical protein